jgi:radical SAM family uncharacterized protein/radical SAM-linked protein
MDLTLNIEKEFLPFVNKPGRFTGNEYNVIHKDLSNIELRVALAFPELYELGMSYLGFDILYHLLNSRNEIWAERVYAPWKDAEDVFREKNIPLFSLESRTPLVAFDWIGFTLQYELTYTNILNMLDLSGIPCKSIERTTDYPVIIGGGPAAGNPEPIASFFDAFLIGDGEEGIFDICDIIKKSKKEKWVKQKLLLELSNITGMYVPSLYQPVYNQFGDFQKVVFEPNSPPTIKKRIINQLNNSNYTLNPLVPLIEVTHDRLALEIMRGCSEGCRFCNAGMIYRPVRQRSIGSIIAQTKAAIHSSGYDEVSFLSLNLSDYDDLKWLMVKEKILLVQERVKFSFPSLRLDALTPEMVDFVKTVKKSGFTFAPEAGSQRLRNVINKNIKDEDIFDTLRLILDNEWRIVKFYFMIGLPTEKDEDILAIAELLKKCIKLATNYREVKFNISISPFSPKPHTPFQWEKQNLPAELERKVQLLRENLKNKNLTISWRDEYVTSLETVFARGGRELGEVLLLAFKKGARFDGWDETFCWETWLAVFDELNIDWRKYLRAKSTSMALPWEHLDMGLTPIFLQQERFKAYEGHISKDCKDFVCLGCGLQRKQFENLVKCYQQAGKKEVKKSPSDFSFVTETSEKPTLQVSYGRGMKKRQATSLSVKKKIRLRFSKVGLSRFLSHLDIIRVFDRAARRANISLVYSQGFNPRPKISFGPPLNLGIASVAEYLDLEAEISKEVAFQSKLNTVLPEGIKILMQKTIYSKVPSLAAEINRQEYLTELEEFIIPYEWIDKWLEREQIEIERLVKGQKKIIDIRPFVGKMKLEDKKLLIVTNSIEGRLAKVSEVLDSLLGEHGIDHRQFFTQRSGQFIVKDNEIFDPFQVI